MLHVVCFGNVWQGDDGFGIHVFWRLREMGGWPRPVKVFDAGTAGLSALGYFDDCSKVVLVDAVKTGGRVGRVRRFRLEDFDPPGPELSLHAVGVDHLLMALPVVFGARAMPEVVVIGAEIGEIHPFTDRLTPPLEAAVNRAIRLIRRELYAKESTTSGGKREQAPPFPA
jgi:hydrogenase maturation protease